MENLANYMYYPYYCHLLAVSWNVVRECLMECLQSVSESTSCPTILPSLYSYSCILYGNDLIWYFNDEKVGGFLPDDSVGHNFVRSYPKSAPVYNVTAVLTQIVPTSRYTVPYCVSVLIVQPYYYSENLVQLMPFNVSCQTHCEDANHSEVCQVKSHKIAGITVIL